MGKKRDGQRRSGGIPFYRVGMKCSAQSVEIVTIYLVYTTISFNPDVVEISLAFVACRGSEMPMIEYITLVPVLSQAPH